MSALWMNDYLQPRVDRLYASMTPRSGLLPAERPWLFRVGDIVRLESGEFVQVVDGFLHVHRGVGSIAPSHAPQGSQVLIICASGTGDRLWA